MKRMDISDFTVLFNVTLPAYSSCTGTGKDRITEKQKNHLHELGLNTRELKCKSQATAIIKEMNRREALGLCSIKSVLLILETGTRPRTPYSVMTEKQAYQIIRRKAG